MTMRLGFAAKVLGNGGMKDADARRWQNNPHLRVSLGYLRAIFAYLHEAGISMYRISSRIAPYITHPDLPQFHHQLDECAEELTALGALAHEYGLRLSMHPEPYTVLNSPDARVVDAAVRDLEFHADFMDALGLGPEAVAVVHGGGVFGDKPAAMARFVDCYAKLAPRVQRRLVLENDEKNYTVREIRAIHDQTGIPLVLDNLHHHVNNPDGLSDHDAAALCLTTWPTGVRPKIHFSSARQEDRVVRRRDRATGKVVTSEVAPLASQHADWIDPDEFARFYHETREWTYDAMLEAKQKDLALLRLRADLAARDIPTE